jgi:hypothetical protein
MKRSFHLVFAACILLGCVGFAPHADAQFWGQPQKQKRPPLPPRPKGTFKTIPLTQPPALPYFPSWTGYKPLYIDGHSYPNLAPIEVYTLSWAYKEPAGTVLNWYTEALKMNGWQVNPQITRSDMVVARHQKEPYEVTFQVSANAKPGYKCIGEVRFLKNPGFISKNQRQQ